MAIIYTYSIKRRGKVSDINVYWSKTDRYIRLMDRLYKEESAEVIDALLAIEAKEDRDPIDFYVNCRGGSACEFFAVYDIIQSLNSKVNTIGLGQCMSAGCFLVMSGSGERKAYPNTRFMLHGQNEGFPYQSHEDQKQWFKHYEDMEKMLINLIAKHAERDIEEVKKDIKRDRFLSAKEAVEYGIIDKIKI